MGGRKFPGGYKMAVSEVLQKEMTAIVISEPGGPEVLKSETVAVPRPEAGEVLIRVAVAGVNRPDVVQRMGLYPVPPGASPLPGLEVSGTVVALGAGVEPEWIGRKICALTNGGGYAEYCVAPVDQCLPVPECLTMAEAAALPETLFTVWGNMFNRGFAREGETVLVHGGTSGIGTTAIQIATALGAEVFATAGSAEKIAAVEALGAHGINYHEADFVDVLKAAGGANLVLDMVGGSYIARNLKAMAEDARLVFIAFLEGPKAEINFAQVMMRRLTITGSTLRPQSDAAKAKIAAELRAHVWPMVASGALRPVMDQEFALEDAAQAHARMETSAHIGKIVLRVR